MLEPSVIRAGWIIALLGTLAGPAGAQSPDAIPADAIPNSPEVAPSPFVGSLLERSKLTGDWLGLRTAFVDRGVSIGVSSTQYYQGVTSGGLEQSFPYGGRNDYFLNVDGEKLGLGKGLSIHMHGETRYGESANFITGALSPVNQFLLVPGETGVVSGITALKFTQVLSENAVIYAGKINLLFELAQPLTGAMGDQGFLNTSLIFNPILARTLPYSTFGAGGIVLRDGRPIVSVAVFDAKDSSTTSIFDGMFSNGAVIFGVVSLPTNWFDLPGRQTVEGVYSSGRYTNISKSPYFDPVDGLVFPGAPRTGSWALGYFFDQALWVADDDSKRKWGVFGRFGLADDNPNPVHWTASAGISGASPLPSRTLDTFGAGYFYLGISDRLKQSARPLTPLRNEQGVELYYNIGVTPWCQITPDLQIVEPFQRDVTSAILFGLRARIDF